MNKLLEALNKNNGFDGNGNLQYAAVTKAVPAFKYVGNQNLRGKSKEEKLSIIKQYLDSGYYLTAEVKGATKGSQHWVAVTKVDDAVHAIQKELNPICDFEFLPFSAERKIYTDKVWEIIESFIL